MTPMSVLLQRGSLGIDGWQMTSNLLGQWHKPVRTWNLAMIGPHFKGNQSTLLQTVILSLREAT